MNEGNITVKEEIHCLSHSYSKKMYFCTSFIMRKAI